MNTPTQIQQALLRTDLWRLLAMSLACPTPDSRREVAQLAAELGECLAEDGASLATPVTLLHEALTATADSDLEGEYHSLFTTQVLVSPYEGSYHLTERGAIIGDIAAFYTAFALQPTAQSGPPDSLPNELALLASLALKEAYALEHGMAEALEVTRTATRQFLEDHLGRWVTIFVRRLLGTTGHPVYVTAAQLLIEAVALAADEVGIENFHYLPGAPATQEAETVLCPVATQCEAADI